MNASGSIRSSEIQNSREPSVELLVVHAVDERLEQCVQVAEPHRVAGDRRHLGVGDQQVGQGLVEVTRRAELEERRAVPEQGRVVGQEVARPVRGVALVQVADDPLLERLGARRRDRRRLERVLGQGGQPVHPLPVGERRVVDDGACLGAQLEELHATSLRAGDHRHPGPEVLFCVDQVPGVASAEEVEGLRDLDAGAVGQPDPLARPPFVLRLVGRGEVALGLLQQGLRPGDLALAVLVAVVPTLVAGVVPAVVVPPVVPVPGGVVPAMSAIAFTSVLPMPWRLP